MSNCGYYKIFKRHITCTHPSDGESNTRSLNKSSAKYHICDMCRRRCGGIYPSELPTIDMRSEEIDIVDKYGRVLNR